MVTTTPINVRTSSKRDVQMANLTACCGMTTEQASKWLVLSRYHDGPDDVLTTQMWEALNEVLDTQYELVIRGEQIARRIKETTQLVARCGNPNPLGELQREAVEYDQACTNLTHARQRLAILVQIYLERHTTTANADQGREIAFTLGAPQPAFTEPSKG